MISKSHKASNEARNTEKRGRKMYIRANQTRNLSQESHSKPRSGRNLNERPKQTAKQATNQNVGHQNTPQHSTNSTNQPHPRSETSSNRRGKKPNYKRPKYRDQFVHEERTRTPKKIRKKNKRIPPEIKKERAESTER